MATREEKVILDIELKEDDIATRLGAIAEETNRLKTQNAELRKQMKSGEVDWKTGAKAIQENELQLKSLKAAEKDASGQLAILTAANRTYSDSNAGVRAQVLDLEKQINSLTEAQKDSAAGKALIAQQNELKEAVKGNAEELGNFQDSVGDYPQVFDLSSTSIGKFQTMLQGLGGESTTVSGVMGNAFKGIKAQAIAMGKVFLSPPIILIAIVLGAIVLALKTVSLAINRNEQTSNKLKVAVSALSGVFNFFLKAVEPIASFLVDVLIVAFKGLGSIVENTSKLVSKSLDLLGFDNAAKSVDSFTASVKGAAKEATVLAKKEAELIVQQRQARLTQLEYQKQAEKLRQIRDDESRSIPERIKANKELGAVLKKQQEAELAIARKSLDVANLRIKIEGANAKNLDAQAEALTLIADIEERITGQQSEQLMNENSLRKEQNERYKEWVEKQKEKIEIARQKAREEIEIEESLQESLNAINGQVDERIQKRKEAAEEARKAADEAVKAIEALKQEVTEEEADISGITKYLDDIQKAKESIASQNEILELERQQSLLDAEYQAAVENALKTGASTALIDEEYALKRQEIFNKTTQANLSNASDFAGNLATIFGESTKLGKAAAAAQVAIDTYKGALAAYSAAASIPVVGPALGIAAAAAVTVKGTKAIKDIYAVKDSFSAGRFATGGIVGGRSYTGDAITARVNSGEMILNMAQQKKLFNTIAAGNISSSNGIDYELLAKAISKLPAPVMGYKEFLSFQEKITTFTEQTKI